MKISLARGSGWVRLLGPSLVLTVALAATSCGEDSSDPASAPPTPSGSPAATAAPSASEPVTSAPVTPTSKPKPTRTPSPPPEGSGDSEGDGEPAAAGGGICTSLSEAEVGAVLGGSVTGAAIPGGGCAFTQERPRPPAASLIELPFAEMANGMTGAKENAISAVEGDPEDISGIGDEAFVVTGTSFGGSDLQGAGAARVGDRLITVTVAQSAGLKRAAVRSLVLGLLRLAVSKAA